MGTDVSLGPILLGDRLCASHASEGRIDPEDRTGAPPGRRLSRRWRPGPHEPYGSPIDGRLVWRGCDEQKTQDLGPNESILSRTPVAHARRLDPTQVAADS